MKKMMVMVMTMLILGGISLLATAEQTNYDIGKVGGSELKIPLGPREAAMGEASVGLADDLNATYWNPAGLSQVGGYNIGFMHNMYLEQTSIEYVAYAQNIFKNAGIGANVMLLNFGKMDKVNEVNGLPEVVGDFSPMVYAVSVGYGQAFSTLLSIGGAVKFYGQNIDTESYSAIAVDVAALFKLEPLGAKGFQAGLAVQNLGTQLGESSLPMNAKVGLAYVAPFAIQAADTWNILADVNLPFGDVKYTSVNLGTEYWYQNIVAARVGYKVKDTGELGGIVGLTAGLGAKIPVGESLSLGLDYAMVSFGDLGMTHQIMVNVGFK